MAHQRMQEFEMRRRQDEEILREMRRRQDLEMQNQDRVIMQGRVVIQGRGGGEGRESAWITEDLTPRDPRGMGPRGTMTHGGPHMSGMGVPQGGNNQRNYHEAPPPQQYVTSSYQGTTLYITLSSDTVRVKIGSFEARALVCVFVYR